jgi:hypothetical protein
MNEAKDQRSIDSSLQMMKARYCLGEYISPTAKSTQNRTNEFVPGGKKEP